MGVKAVVLAAGDGTRMRSSVPKVLHEIAGRPLVNWVLNALEGLEVGVTAVVTKPGAGAVQAALGDGLLVAEQVEQLGTAHATRTGVDALDVVSGDVVLVLPADTPLLSTETLIEMLDMHQRRGATATLLTAVVGDPAGYGRVVRDESGLVTGVVEHADASPAELDIGEINGGIYAFDGPALVEALEEVSADNAQGEYYLPDVIGMFTSGARIVAAHRTVEEELAGVNSQDQLASAAAVLRRRINSALMADGVWMQDPDRTYIDAGVTVEAGTRLLAGVHLEGDTAIGARAEIGPDVYLRDSDVGEDAKVWYAVVRQASIGDGAQVGPYVSLRPGATLLDGAKAGTFVEMKNATLREGAKASHLAYLGDADVGEGANIGAGTITVNYDGFTKSRTVVGKGARVGSNTMLVAPVEIGEGAFTGAGSVITEDVAAGALAVERSAQKEVPGYAARKRERHERDKAD